ncbi:MAG: GNAT family N-acetyltransferase [Myxococcota bacterium]|jgi:GNAT superfamily N-acetyltransferase|nr:GNAT family N-acetyltransferase [Myxococcota bacterium]
MGSGAEVRIDPLGPEGERAAAGMLARAFLDNPVNRAVIRGGPHRRLRANTYGMHASLRASRRFSHRRVLVEVPESVRESSPSAALVAMNPGGYPVAPPPIGVQLRCLWGQGLGVMRRFGTLYRRLDERHPKSPHAYLALLATHPNRRGRGYGRALLSGWLRDVDALGVESYLETDRRELLAFYQSAGFEVASEIRAFDIPIWCMQRPARSSQSAVQGDPGAGA